MIAAAVALATLLAASPADWDKSFAAPALSTYLPPERIDLLVAAAGEPREAVRAATSALQRALVATGTARAVLDDAALGDLATASDAKIVELARDIPVQLIAVVRVTTATATQGPVAVVTLYGRNFRVWKAFTAEAGVPLAPMQATAPQLARPVEPAETSDTVERLKRRAREEAEDQYEQKYIGFADEAVVYIDNGRVATRWTTMFQGKYRLPLEGAAFYDLIGREDLAKKYRTRSTIKLGLVLGGIGVTATGAAIAIYGLAGRCTKTNVATGECLAHDSKLATSGAVIGGVGLLAMLATATFSTHPIDLFEARKLADEYNKELKRSLGLLAESEDSGARPEPGPQLALDLGVLDGPGLGTLGLRLRW